MGAPRNLRGEVTAQDILVLEEAVFELAQQIFQGNQHSRNPDLLTIKTSGIAVLCNQGYAGWLLITCNKYNDLLLLIKSS